MNAYELFDAAFDSANDHREPTAANGDGSNDFHHMVRAPLEEIEL